jgi:hypothetical protein
MVDIVWADHPPRRLASRSDSFLTVPVRISIAYLKDEELILSLKPCLTFRDPESIKYMESILPLGPSLIVEDPSGVVKYLISMESTDKDTVDSRPASPQSVGAENAFKKIWAEMMIADSPSDDSDPTSESPDQAWEEAESNRTDRKNPILNPNNPTENPYVYRYRLGSRQLEGFWGILGRSLIAHQECE